MYPATRGQAGQVQRVRAGQADVVYHDEYEATLANRYLCDGVVVQAGADPDALFPLRNQVADATARWLRVHTVISGGGEVHCAAEGMVIRTPGDIAQLDLVERIRTSIHNSQGDVVSALAPPNLQRCEPPSPAKGHPNLDTAVTVRCIGRTNDLKNQAAELCVHDRSAAFIEIFDEGS